jgi:drug/metabolite transporter (DMT)-like permease
VSFAWGLKITGATSASLLLNCEAVFTVILARAFYGEPIGRRVLLALVLMAAGGGCLVLAGHSGSEELGMGAFAIIAATFAWSLDNALTRPLAELDPVQIVRWKAALGAALGVALSIRMHDPLPSLWDAAALLICGGVLGDARCSWHSPCRAI